MLPIFSAATGLPAVRGRSRLWPCSTTRLTFPSAWNGRPPGHGAGQPAFSSAVSSDTSNRPAATNSNHTIATAGVLLLPGQLAGGALSRGSDADGEQHRPAVMHPTERDCRTQIG